MCAVPLGPALWHAVSVVCLPWSACTLVSLLEDTFRCCYPGPLLNVVPLLRLPLAVLYLTYSLGCNTGQLLGSILLQILSDFCTRAPRGLHPCATRGLELVHILTGPVGPTHVLWVERVLSLKPICKLHPAVMRGALIHFGQRCSWHLAALPDTYIL